MHTRSAPKRSPHSFFDTRFSFSSATVIFFSRARHRLRRGFTGGTGFHLVALQVALFFLRYLQFRSVSPSFIGFYWVLLGFTGFYWVLLGFTGFYWVLLTFTEFNWVPLVFYGIEIECNYILRRFTGFLSVSFFGISSASKFDEDSENLTGSAEIYWVRAPSPCSKTIQV